MEETFTVNPEIYREKVDVLKALAHPVRLCIVRGLMTNKGCNVSAMKECLEIPQSTLSQHLAKLRNMGILKGEREGLEVHYYVISEDARRVVKALFTEEEIAND